jgi:hypothetical protein
VAAVIAVVAALVARPDSDHHQTRVGTHPPTTQPALNPTQAYLNDIHGPYQSYHFALNRASTACFTWGVSVVANCHTQAQDAVAAAEQLLVVLAQATPPPTLTAASQQIRSAVTNVVTYLNAAIAAATANNPGAVRAAAGNFLGADADLCGPIGRLNQFAPSGAGQFTNQSSNDCNS